MPDPGPTGRAPAARLANLTTRLLGMAATHADRIVNERLAAVAARKWHYAVLATLDEFGPASQAELSDRTGIYRSDVVAVVNELVERDQVLRAPDPADRRRNVISLTPGGRQQLRRLDALLGAAQDEVFAPLDEAERAQLRRLLARVVEHHAAAGWPPR